MFFKCLILLFCGIIIDAHFDYQHCPSPKIKNGYGRLRQRGNLVRYYCRPRFILMGNRYASCRMGRWDVPPPTCIKSGCENIDPIAYAVTQTYHNDAWMLFFCFPGYSLVGSPVIYCDGTQWNATAPTCVDSSAPTKTSCDFEQPDICGWKQDELHDFDWRRLNRRTPSSYLLTGPQYDHTLGMNGTGFYMYIESTSRLTNDTARLISPVFDEKLTKDGCFVFYYHMYGNGIGGLRVYQKPDSMNLYDVLRYSDKGKNKYMLFEQWGNQGNTWFTGYAGLLDVADDFQIVIEGIRGSSFLSDIAIDDVSILQGDNCTGIAQSATTPISVSAESCVGRCDSETVTLGTCECNLACVVFDTCCADYIEVCEFPDGNNDPTAPSSVSMGLPQTEKLVATTKATTTTKIPYTTIPDATNPTIILTETTSSTKLTSQTTAKNASTALKTIRTTATTIRHKSANKTVVVTTTPSYTRKNTSTKATPLLTLSTKKSLLTSKVPIKLSTIKFNPRPTPDWLRTPTQKVIVEKTRELKGSNSGVITVVVVLLVLSVCCGTVFGVYKMRTAAGCATLARWRGRVTSDPEVRYLNADIDVNIDED